VEHEQPEQEHDQAQKQADELEAKADELEQRKDEFGAEVKDVKEDWEQKQQSPEVPGAQQEGGPDAGEPPGGAGGEASDRGEESEANPDEGGDDDGS
jgi:hypothetical protein